MIRHIYITVAALILLRGTTFGWQPDNSLHEPLVYTGAVQWQPQFPVRSVGYGWALEAWFTKPVTVPYEPIALHLKITNESGESKPTPNLSYKLPDIAFDLYDSDGNAISLLQYRMSIVGGSDTTRRLAPAGCRSVRMDLLSLAGANVDFRSGDWLMLPVGVYSVAISLYLDPLHRIPREEYTLTLPPLTFRVIDPTGDSAKALELFRTALFATMKDPKEAIDLFERVMSDYPDTPYDYITNKRLLSLLPLGRFFDPKKLINTRIRFLLRYPDSPDNRHNVS